MKWTDDVALAVSGDEEASARLGEYLLPFVHGVLLAHAPHHLANLAAPRLLEGILRSLDEVPVESLGPRVLLLARRQGQKLATQHQAELPSKRPDLSAARQHLARLRPLLESTRERLVLRLVEGVPGPEIALVSQAPEREVRADLERGTIEALKLLGLSPGGIAWVWKFDGAPSPGLARLETQLTALRYDPAEVVELPFETGTGSTWQDLAEAGDALPGSGADEVSDAQRTALTTGDSQELTATESVGLPVGPEGTVAGPTIRSIDVPVAAKGPIALSQTPVRSQDETREAAEVTAGPPSGLVGETSPVARSDVSFEGTPTDRPVIARGGSPGGAAPGGLRAATEREVRTFPPPRAAPRAALVVAGAVLLAAVLLLAARAVFQGPQPHVDVLVAGRDVAEGVALVGEDFASSPVRPGAEGEALKPLEAASLLGVKTPVPLQAGDPLFLVLARLPALREKGRWRAVRLLAPATLEVSSGDRVDVRVSRPGSSSTRAQTAPVADGVPVLVLPVESPPRKRQAPLLALLLSPKDAARLELAQRVGRLELLLQGTPRGPDDPTDFLAAAAQKELVARRAASLRLIRR